jgi:hypothetical protein
MRSASESDRLTMVSNVHPSRSHPLTRANGDGIVVVDGGGGRKAVTLSRLDAYEQPRIRMFTCTPPCAEPITTGRHTPKKAPTLAWGGPGDGCGCWACSLGSSVFRFGRRLLTSGEGR